MMQSRAADHQFQLPQYSPAANSTDQSSRDNSGRKKLLQVEKPKKQQLGEILSRQSKPQQPTKAPPKQPESPKYDHIELDSGAVAEVVY
jgi:hypothetical protein